MDHPEPISTKRDIAIPQCRKGLKLEEARTFVDSVMETFHSLEDMKDLKSMYETGKQLSRAYFDCHQYRAELAEHLTILEYPAFASKMMKKLNNMGVFKNDDIWFSSFYFYNTTWNFSETWPDFATALASAGLPNLLNLNIGHQPYLENLASKNVYYLIKASLSIIHNIARVPSNVHYFITDAVKQALVHLSQREEEFLRCVSTLCLAYIVNESETNLLATGTQNDSLHVLLSYIATARSSEKRRCHGFQVAELLSALAVLSVNDSVKVNILTASIPSSGQNTCVSMLKETLSSAVGKSDSNNPGAQREAEEAVKTLLNLSMDPNTLSSFSSQVGSINSDSTMQPKSISRCLDAFNWRLATNGATRTGNAIDHQDATPGLILLSYTPANKLVVDKIANRLRSAGYPIWTAPHPDYVSIPEACAVGLSGVATGCETHDEWLDALDAASIIIVCASDVYRQSPICRMEAEYLSESSQKHLIMVNMQAKFKPSGWLTAFSNSKQILDFSGKRDLEASYENLLSQVNDLFSECKRVASEMTVSKNQIDEKTPSETTVNTPVVLPAASNNHIDGLSINATSPNPNNGSLASNNQMSTLGREQSVPHNLEHFARSEVLCARPLPPLSASLGGIRVWKFAVRPEIRSWSTSKVSQWLKFRGLSHVTNELAGGLDGILLSQLAGLRVSSPEYFGHCLRKDLVLNLSDSLKLMEALDDLAPENDYNDANGHETNVDAGDCDINQAY